MEGNVKWSTHKTWKVKGENIAGKCGLCFEQNITGNYEHSNTFPSGVTHLLRVYYIWMINCKILRLWGRKARTGEIM